MDNLIDLIRAAIDHTEQLAQAALHHPCRYDHDLRDYVDTGVDDGQWEASGREVETAHPAPGEGFQGGIHIYDEGGHNEQQAAHIAHNDPAAALRACRADHKLLAAVELNFFYAWAQQVLEILAEKYSITDGGEA